MENCEKERPWPEVERRGKPIKFWVKWEDKELGPWDWVGKTRYTDDQKSWAIWVKRGKRSHLLIDGIEYGPFDRYGSKEWFTGTLHVFACTVIRGREIFLIEGGRMDKKGEILEESGGTFLKIRGRSFGPFNKVTDLRVGPNGRHWAADVEKKGGWHGFIVDGIEYGPFPKQFFGPLFSSDGSRWFVILGRGREEYSDCSFILDGNTYGRLMIGDMGFCNDNRFYYDHIRRKNYYVVLEDREIGPFLHDRKDWDYAGSNVWAIMGYIRRGRRKPRRCVIFLWIAEENRRVYFSPNGGGSLEDAIEVINADDTETGVMAEHKYMHFILKSQKIAGEFAGQRLFHKEGRRYDQLIYKVDKRKKFSVFFDITSFYGI